MVDPGKRALALGLAASSLGLIGTARAIQHERPPANGGTKRMTGTAMPAADAIVDAAWDLPETRNERVDFFIEFLRGKRYDDMRLWQERLGRYAPMIQQRLRDRGMPTDLIYLTMIESGFDPNAYSSADAAGIWQFIAPTARRYGLEVSEYVDERRDPVKATGAAVNYLEDLYDQFGSWYLAAAAYNTGEGRIERILNERMGGARGDDALYWEISPNIPRETRDYVPLMLAAGHISKEPDRYGFHNLDYQEPFAFETVEVPGGTPLGTVARASGVDEQAVVDLNPDLVKQTTPPDRRWSVRIPVDTRARFVQNFDRVMRAERGG